MARSNVFCHPALPSTLGVVPLPIELLGLLHILGWLEVLALGTILHLHPLPEGLVPPHLDFVGIVGMILAIEGLFLGIVRIFGIVWIPPHLA